MDTIISANENLLLLIHAMSSSEYKKPDSKDVCEIIEKKHLIDWKLIKKVKISEFNYEYKKDDAILIYNTLYNSLARLSDEEYGSYKEQNVKKCALSKEFIEAGFWVDDAIEEKHTYLTFAREYTLNFRRPLAITVTTTTKCNARCDYCYEKGIKQTDIYDGAVNDIIQFVKSKATEKTVFINWFGGEPLMNTKTMDELSIKLEEAGFDYLSYIITNGSKLDVDIIEDKLEKWHVHDMQITLDGPQDIYSSRKNYINKEEGDFYRILKNIIEVAKKKIHISIRMNLDKSNWKNIVDLIKEIEPIFAKYDNVSFYPAFITGSDNPLSEDEKVECVKQMMLTVTDIRKLTTGTKFYSLPRMHACMNGDPNSFSIDVYGNIYTCEHYVGRCEHAIGSLKDFLDLKDDRAKCPEFDSECEECVFLPKCFGGCESNRKEGDKACMIEKYIMQAYMQII